MGTNRLEAFSDGVIAILITIMVLELRPPHEPTLHALRPLLPVFLAYALSFLNVAIYWNNHHHMLQLARTVTGGVLWANLHLLFWLSLVPFVTDWLGEAPHAPMPTFAYAVVQLGAAFAYLILQSAIIRADGTRSPLAAAVGGDRKGKLSSGLYVAALLLALVRPAVAQGIFVIVALVWLVPDRRIEARLRGGASDRPAATS